MSKHLVSSEQYKECGCGDACLLMARATIGQPSMTICRTLSVDSSGDDEEDWYSSVREWRLTCTVVPVVKDEQRTGYNGV